MAYTACCLCLAAETLYSRGIRYQLRPERFDCDHIADYGTLSLVDCAGRALSHDCQDVILFGKSFAEQRADEWLDKLCAIARTMLHRIGPIPAALATLF